jgi:hypothetical protein
VALARSTRVQKLVQQWILQDNPRKRDYPHNPESTSVMGIFRQQPEHCWILDALVGNDHDESPFGFDRINALRSGVVWRPMVREIHSPTNQNGATII